jgi:hypothetical protein
MFAANAADEVRVPSLLTLEYPNGRTAEVAVEEKVAPGQTLELYGRRWKVLGRVSPVGRGGRTASHRYSQQVDQRLVCRPIS